MSYSATVLDAYGNLAVSTSSKLTFNTRTLLKSPADGYLLLQNNAGTNFSGIRLGGTSTSFPAIHTNGSSIDIRFGSGNNYNNLAGKSISGTTITNSSAVSNTSSSILITGLDGYYKQLGGNLTTPNGNVIGNVGDVYKSTVGDGYTYVWVKQSAGGTNTGWEPRVRENLYNIFYKPYNRRDSRFFEDFNTLIGNTNQNITGFNTFLSGGTITTTQLSGGPLGYGSGVAQLDTGTGTSGFASMTYGYQALPGFYTAFRGRIGFWISTLSDATNTYSMGVGMFLSVAGNYQRQELMLQYTNGTNGGRFQLISNLNGTVIDTGVTVAANKFYIFDYSMPKVVPGSTAISPFNATIYNITDGVSSTFTGLTIAGNASGAAIETGLASITIIKSAGTIARQINVDFVQFDSY